MNNELTFTEAMHEYKLNGVIIGSVTQIIKDAGLIDYSLVPKELLEVKSDLGQKVHSTTELYDLGTLDKKDLHPVLKNYLKQWIKFRKDYNFIPTHIEYELYHPLYKYAGRIDRVGTRGTNLTLLDLKTANPQRANALQTAAYKEMFEKQTGLKIKERMTVYLFEDSYKVEIHNKPDDLPVFLAALSIYNYKRRK